ncbi:MAG: GDP-mannose 4,6-dehydratase, partial [Lentisphaeria bacterium]|nr:GDP-mannose 4,6-dehydratase [Lentisphaeria bacterium]
IFAGSAEEYGRSTDTSFKESDICTPSNPYALSKFTAAEAMQMLADKNAANFIHLRLANHFGPNQRKGFVTADFSLQIAERMLNGDTSDISVGNLEAMRDFLYIDDVIDAYIKIIESPQPVSGTYNIGSGNPVKISDILSTLLEISGCRANVSVDPAKFRSADIKRMSLDISKISSELNWYPKISLKDGLSRTFNAAMEQLRFQ